MTELSIASLDAALRTMCSVATRVITEHRDNGGLCVACGQAWPCECVVLADHNLDVAHAAASAALG